jgi:hypothetical protein
MSREQLILDKLDIFTCQVSKTSGRKKLQKADFKEEVREDLPPDTLASLGSKKVVSPEILKVPQKFEGQIRRRIAEIGFAFLNSVAVAKSETARLVKDLDKICAEANKWRDNELPKIFHEEQEKWLSKDPKWEPALRAHAPSLAEVQMSMKFGYALYQVVANESAPGTLTQEVSELGSRLLESVADDVNEYYGTNIQDGKASSLKAIGVASLLRRVRRKLNSLSFLEGSAQPMIAALDELLSSIPDKGNITGAVYWQTVAMITTLGDPDKVRSHGQGQITVSGQAAQLQLDAVGDFLPAAEEEHQGDLLDGHDDDEVPPAPEEEEGETEEVVVVGTSVPVPAAQSADEDVFAW